MTQRQFVDYSLSDAPSTAALLNARFRTLDEDLQLRHDAARAESKRS